MIDPLFFPSDSDAEESGLEKASRIAHRARNGIFYVFHIPLDPANIRRGQIRSAKIKVRKFVQEISKYSTHLIAANLDLAPNSNAFRIVDTALSDSEFVFESMIDRALEEANSANRKVDVKVLLANPDSEFAHARSDVLGSDPIVRLGEGLKNICRVLADREICAFPQDIEGNFVGSEKISELIRYINLNCHELGNLSCEVRLYNGTLYGPSYFFRNILLQGKYSPATSGSANVMPWLVLVNNPEVKNDMYDIWAHEFETLWESQKSSPEYKHSANQANIYILLNRRDSRFEESFNGALRSSFPTTPSTFYTQAFSRSSYETLREINSLNSSIKASKIIIVLLDRDFENSLPLEVTLGMLNNKRIAILNNGGQQNHDLLLARGCDKYTVYDPNELNRLFGEIGNLLGIDNPQINISQIDTYFRDRL